MEIKELIIDELLKSDNISDKTLSDIKRKFAKQLKISCPSNIDLLLFYHKLKDKKSITENKKVEEILRTRPIRSLAGVVNVSVLTKPYDCPGKCIYCPSEINLPKSYLSGEPAVERAKRLDFDPYLQTAKRIEVLSLSGHPTDKIELRMIGGTWSFYEKKYKIWFVKNCFNACNGTRNESYDQNIPIETLWKKLKIAQKKNEKAEHRIVGLSFETRPDFIDLKEAEEMKRLGATKIELGVQSIDDEILKLTKRGHLVDKTIKATKLLKNAGFKVAYQIMLDLPESNPEKDIDTFKVLFTNPDFQPDYLKIYPCALIKETPMFKMYKNGSYKPYDKRTLIDTIKAIKRIIPHYTRVERIIRDIPAPLIVEGGAKISNLRQIIEAEMKEEDWRCQCIRCREAKSNTVNEKTKLFRIDYDASDGKEIFLSIEDENRKNLYSLLRLRIPDPKDRAKMIPILRDRAIIRELHTYGQAVSIAKTDPGVQHRGLGKRLIKEAERIMAEDFKIKKVAIISGVGVRSYYREKLGYRLRDEYMIKRL
ncbi:MAG: tRNA uridine(34) 5-carboxymethylaminomethyl modification radical SAM/GNAT enzyme Elp3 [Candidatus Pacebacteria bacterium]|nr:tRNA uridine(34) 5-carboxymethylaminomethyl modification radical SAM/GNAT enzyme Elp3 [Candidatus Paceibacterota bacterium]